MPDHEPDLTPEQTARRRRLLAEARHVEPVPDAVAARLDDVLAQLADQPLEEPTAHPGGTGASSPVLDLAARRRRRVVAMLAAAAAVVVLGVAVSAVVEPPDDDAGVSSQSADDDLDQMEGEAEDGSTLESQAPPAAPEEIAPPAAPDPSVLPPDAGSARAAAEMTDRTFAADVRRLQDAPGVRVEAGTQVEAPRLSTTSSFVCDTADYGAGKLVPVLYDQLPAVLAFRPATGQTQTVELLQCGSADVLRSTTLPLP